MGVFFTARNAQEEGKRIKIRVVKNCFLTACLSVALVLCLVPALLLASAAEARPHRPAYSEVISAQQAAQAARAATGGRVLAVRLSGSSYRVKVLIRDGVVRVVYVDARSGRVSG